MKYDVCGLNRVPLGADGDDGLLALTPSEDGVEIALHCAPRCVNHVRYDCGLSGSPLDPVTCKCHSTGGC